MVYCVLCCPGWVLVFSLDCRGLSIYAHRGAETAHIWHISPNMGKPLYFVFVPLGAKYGTNSGGFGVAGDPFRNRVSRGLGWRFLTPHKKS